MTANELRIGNYFQQPNDEKIYSVLAIDEDNVAYGKDEIGFNHYWWWEIEHIIPIPLTSEILEKAGFKKCDRVEVGWELNGFQDMGKHGVIQRYISTNLLKLHYVHQLQNLIFALTGEELNIEL